VTRVTEASERQRRRFYLGEERWFGLLQEVGLPALRRGFLGAGMSPTVAGQLVWFLYEQLTLDRSLSAASRRKYRDELDRLDYDIVAREARRAMPLLLNSPCSCVVEVAA
jgi:hypothetical protein